MADVLIDNETAPGTPAAGKSIVWVDSGSKKLAVIDDTGRINGVLSRNDATASQGAGFAVDTYVTNSGILIPSFGMKALQLYRWTISLSKTAAGVAAPIIAVRVGVNQSTADTARLTLTGVVASVATATQGLLTVNVAVRNIAAGGVVAGGFGFTHPNFGDGGSGVSAGFDNTALAGQFIGLSFNGGIGASITLTHVAAELIG